MERFYEHGDLLASDKAWVFSIFFSCITVNFRSKVFYSCFGERTNLAEL
jgi:hypothetical protein